MIQSNKLACVILASGASARFGSSKMLYELEEGISILTQTIRIYAAVFDQVHVVVRFDDKLAIELVRREGAICIENLNPEHGISQSIVAGVDALAPSTAWLFALGDMPYVLPTTVRSLLLSAAVESIVVPRTSRGIGNPIVFGADFKSALLGLTGDVGAKPLLKRHAQQIRFYDCEDDGIHHDIDRISDIL
ncbi:MAG: molybdenum cofactor cytidylyltransferase [Arenicella sp.]|jgi:molybdenum cofactor cytidylyltransferase